MESKDYIIKVLKSKTFYAVLLIVYLVNSAMTINRTHNTDKLERYYGSTGHGYATAAIAEPIEELIPFALEQLGKPYRYGAKGPNSFDCSGFTGYVFRNFDIKLSASARLQAKQGVEVSKEEVLPGDLVFFKSPTSGNEQIGHVGIVVSASKEEGIEFIHSSTSRGVRIDNLKTSRHYSKRYRGARRVL
ncbi:NlpC/P60 family protein [Fulvivirga sp. RKSG066]|uniref:C40 family peptidase n=1 Tax=Fulvivirga aurantia TaxID=2529383 RepID=UPI0012BD6C66|nr:C40 family peptidase [Fulvivirga aurantia]MTI19526.1 NlpC/P60 family protein [Fulvivirga aurantia]